MKRLTKKLFINAINDKKPLIDPNSSWVQEGKPMFVKDILISSGLFYLSHSYKKGTDYEKFGISLSLPVDLKGVDYVKRVLPRVPSYVEASPACRGTYLKWLSEGCPMEKVHVGYPLLYLLGMEVYYFRGDNKYQKEVILKKAQQIASCLEHEELFMRHYRSFCSAVKVKSVVEASEKIYTCQPATYLPLGEFPLDLRFAFSQMAYERKPLSADWAFVYLINHPQINIRESAMRVWKQFSELFIYEYNEKIRDSIILENKGLNLSLDYRFFNSSCPISWTSFYDEDFKDVLEENSHLYTPLVDLYESVSKKIISYSRFLARNSKYVGSLYESLKLPRPLRNKEGTMTHKLVECVKNLFQKRNIVTLSLKEIQSLSPVDRGKSSEDFMLLLKEFFQEQGWELYPSVVDEERLLYRSLSTIVVYKKPENVLIGEQEKLIHERHFYFALALSYLMEDRGWLSITLRESWLDHFFDQNPSIEGLRDSFTAMFVFYQHNSPSLRVLSEIFSVCEGIVEPLFQSVVLFFVEYGLLDNAILKNLTDLYEVCGLSNQTLFHHVNALRFLDKKKLFKDEMIVFFRGSNKVLYGDTKCKDSKRGVHVVLDTEILKKREDETKQVSELLEGVFVSQDDHVEVRSTVSSDQEQFDMYLKKLVSKEFWSYDDVTSLLKDWKISIYDFIEKVNDWSYEERGECLVVDEGQGIRVYLDVWEDL